MIDVITMLQESRNEVIDSWDWMAEMLDYVLDRMPESTNVNDIDAAFQNALEAIQLLADAIEVEIDRA